MRFVAVALVLSSALAAADDGSGSGSGSGDITWLPPNEREQPEPTPPQVQMTYDEIRNIGTVSLAGGLTDEECGEGVGFGLVYATKGKPETSKSFVLKPSLDFWVSKDFDVGDFHRPAFGRVSIPFLVDGKRGQWRGEFDSKVSDCDVHTKTCTHDLSVRATVTKADLQRLAKAKRAKLRPFDGVDCEFGPATKALIVRFLRETPALK
jgi:hypothetical protein